MKILRWDPDERGKEIVDETVVPGQHPQTGSHNPGIARPTLASRGIEVRLATGCPLVSRPQRQLFLHRVH